MHSKRTIFASEYGPISNLSPTLKPPTKSKVELEPERLLSKQSCGDLLALPSQEYDSWQKPAELPIGDRPAPALSGLVISFGKTLQYLPQKTVTRRAWKDGHAKKFANAFGLNKLVQAFDKDRRYGGKQIGWCRLLCAPYKEQLSAMPDEDLIAEGGMCSTVEEFVKHYFKGNSSLEVWVIRFEFVPLGVYPALAKQTNTNSSIHARSESIHQTSLVTLGVYQHPEKQTNTSSPIYSPVQSIHQDSLVTLGVYPASEKQTNINYSLYSRKESIHQTELAFLGVYQPPGKQTNTNFLIPSLAESIHQDSLNPLGVYQPSENQTNINFLIVSLINSIHQDSLVPLDIYPILGKQTNTYSPLFLQVESIHQPSLVSFGVYPSLEKQTNTYPPIPLLAESIHQAPLLPFGVYPAPEKKINTYLPTSLLAESIHQALLLSFGVYPAPEKKTNTYSPIPFLAESIHQGLSTENPTIFSMWQNETPRFEAIGFCTSDRDGNLINSNPPVTLRTESIHQDPLEVLPTLDLSQFERPRNNTNFAIVLATESLPQNLNEKLNGCSGGCDISDTNSAIPTASESTDASPTIQGGCGLVYSFWKGESIVNHYRYKVKIGGKWKVKSIYIPVGKLPQVKEAIANKLGVTAIVVEILCKKL